MDLDPQGNEVHRLTGRNLSSSIPLHQRDEWWYVDFVLFIQEIILLLRHGFAPRS